MSKNLLLIGRELTGKRTAELLDKNLRKIERAAGHTMSGLVNEIWRKFKSKDVQEIRILNGFQLDKIAGGFSINGCTNIKNENKEYLMRQINILKTI